MNKYEMLPVVKYYPLVGIATLLDVYLVQSMMSTQDPTEESEAFNYLKVRRVLYRFA